ncbi:hypothetical protein K5F93_11600 [Pseudomonas protegens]|uniref:hypothetical protein n=1 Tax=Pseudomonas protegens TaxID=380021 RepID=UPI001C8F0A77|nr:hypothetical protein [Pseudomonas protegens]QZI72873.1 hypothetical protein K5F93_11600 [Pseudomonas protegens]
MNRQQIATAHHLLWTRDQVQGRLDTVLGGSGVALMISGQGYPEALAAVTEPLADHFRKELKAIDGQLRLLGWNGE